MWVLLSIRPVGKVKEEDLFPLIFYSGLRGRLLSVKKKLKAWKSPSSKLKLQIKRFSNAQKLEQALDLYRWRGEGSIRHSVLTARMGNQVSFWKLTQREVPVREPQNSLHVVTFPLPFLSQEPIAVRQREGGWVFTCLTQISLVEITRSWYVLCCFLLYLSSCLKVMQCNLSCSSWTVVHICRCTRWLSEGDRTSLKAFKELIMLQEWTSERHLSPLSA